MVKIMDFDKQLHQNAMIGKDDRKLYKQPPRHQIKSSFYYIFWGIATFSVVAGQVYVGSGYRMFARSLNRIFDTVEIEVGQDYNNERFY